MTAPFIQFRSISHHFSTPENSHNPVLENLSIDIGRNEFVSVVGPSGCGKSTLLRMLSGLLGPASGEILVKGTPLTEAVINPGIVFQKPTLLPWLSVRDNILFPAKHRFGKVSDQQKKLAVELIELIGLADFSDAKPNSLSGGMQQKVAIARSLLLGPDLLLMDEPFSALDALSREKLGIEMVDILAVKPKTVIFITHSIAEAVQLSDRVVVLSPRPAKVMESIDIELPRPRTSEALKAPDIQESVDRIKRYLFYPELFSPEPGSSDKAVPGADCAA